MKNNADLRELSFEEMLTIRGGGPDPEYIGPAITPEDSDRSPKGGFFDSFTAMLIFGWSALFGGSDK